MDYNVDSIRRELEKHHRKGAYYSDSQSGGSEYVMCLGCGKDWPCAGEQAAVALKEMQRDLLAMELGRDVAIDLKKEADAKLTEAMRLLTEAMDFKNSNGQYLLPKSIHTRIAAFLKDASPLPTPEQVAQTHRG